MIDYSIFYYRTHSSATELSEFDIFISAYNSSERVKTVFTNINASKKLWLIHPEYLFNDIELPDDGEIIKPEKSLENVQVQALLKSINNINEARLCIDITGFMRHVLIFLVASLKKLGVKKFTAIYSEPTSYSNDENTEFSTTTSSVVRSIQGISADIDPNYQDHLIINIGYDHKIISQVATYKDSATIHPLFSFPSLSADMYQQSAFRASFSGDITKKDDWFINRKFAPANNPFATAQIVSELIHSIDISNSFQNNIYLAPLSTKAQTLGFALYWALEGEDRDISILLPECIKYSRETSRGLKRLWSYEIELTIN
ncbi:hypothetical protein [Acinetobacter baumannii]|uniref:hypothetical protein n=1 Tax=Acinetobacter baumannii TaxID=470 RepID=UPI000BF688EA|nr:hypothetical protein [Acinetobacter baumannii]WCS38460.1 hypothetical protein OSV60_01050 [Acinetobacter baumannii]